MIHTVFLKHKNEVLPAMVHDENLQKFLDIGYVKTYEEAEKVSEKAKKEKPTKEAE